MIVDCRKLSDTIRNNIKNELKSKHPVITPRLAIIRVGDDYASDVYVRNKKRACENVGIECDIYTYPESIEEQDIISKIFELNLNPLVSKIIVQLPLPKHINEYRVIQAIWDEKDVDNFKYSNIGKTFCGVSEYGSCTATGILRILESVPDYQLEGKHAVIVGRSNSVGKQIASLLLNRNCTVTITHSKTKNLKDITKTADILVVAIGKPKMITSDYIKDGSFVIDVGINRDENNKLVGDVDFENVKDKAGYITPVPNGVGLMTVTCILERTIEESE